MEYRQCKHALACRLVNVRSGMKYLSKVPFAPAFADMAVTAGVLLRDNKQQDSLMPVTNRLLHEWNISGDQLLEDARQNMYRILTPKIFSMKELMLSEQNGSVLKGVEAHLQRQYPDAAMIKQVSVHLAELFCKKYDEANKSASMWVLSNRDWIFGASGLLYPEVLERFADSHNVSFYILPASVHEVILIPQTGVDSEEWLKNMLKTANIKAMENRRFLSDCVYYYDKEKMSIRCL